MSHNSGPAANAPKLVAGSPAVVSHTFVRFRGRITGHLTAHDARTEQARVSLTLGTVHQNFWSAQASQGVLEGMSAAKATLAHLPSNVGPSDSDGYDQPAIAIDWTKRPAYAVTPRARVTTDKRTTLKWTDVYMGPVTFQVLDRAAFYSVVELLRDVHRISAAVCLDGAKYRGDPTRDDYKPQLEPHLL